MSRRAAEIDEAEHETDRLRVSGTEPRRGCAGSLRAAAATALLFASVAALAAREPATEIAVSFEDRAHHEARVSVRFRDLPPAPLEVRMSRSSPGRYALHEFAKNVYSVAATDSRGRPLRIERPDAHQWTVHGHDGEVRFEYTLFADRVDGTYSAIDTTHAHLNAPASFVWARGLEDRPVRVTFELPRRWRVASQLAATDSPETWTAPDLQYLMDSPIEIGEHQVVEWPVPGSAAEPGSEQTARLVLHHLGTEAEGRAYAKAAAAIVAEEIAIFGEPPRFDHGTYTFLADYLPWASGDGMEHRNSTVLTSRGSIAGSAVGLLGTVAHEFFHAWNIERIRPRSLEPFDFERANVSSELWFGEGFTSYFDDLTLRRAGLVSFERFARSISRSLSFVLTTPARSYGGPVAMSRQAPFVDAATSNDPVNRGNTFVSYYTYGAVLGLGLDLELRTRFGVSLDDYLRAMWERHGRPEVPYDLEDLERVLGEVSRDPAWAAEYFARSIEGSELPDFAALLRAAGLELRPRHPDAAWLGVESLEVVEEGVLLDESAVVGGPFHAAGIDRGDTLLEIDGRPISSREELRSAVEDRKPGDRVTVLVRRRGGDLSPVEVRLARDPEMEVVPFEVAGRTVTPEIERFRREWLGSKADRAERLERFCPEDGEAFPFEFEYCPRHGNGLEIAPAAPRDSADSDAAALDAVQDEAE